MFLIRKNNSNTVDRSFVRTDFVSLCQIILEIVASFEVSGIAGKRGRTGYVNEKNTYNKYRITVVSYNNTK